MLLQKTQFSNSSVSVGLLIKEINLTLGSCHAIYFSGVSFTIGNGPNNYVLFLLEVTEAYFVFDSPAAAFGP